MRNDFIYDIETYPNVFTLTVEHAHSPMQWVFEISDRCNDSTQITSFMSVLAASGARLVGFNNTGFDYPVLHKLLRNPSLKAADLYQAAMLIIHSQDDENRWQHMVYESDRLVPQVDLFKIHHFDNKARATSLKALEFNMRADSIEDLPFPVGTILTGDQINILRQYNAHDVTHTKVFYRHTDKMIDFREDMQRKYPGKDWLNFNDTKIGKEFFIMELEKAGVACYDFGPSGRAPRQSKRPVIHLRDAILPSICFVQPEFTRILEWLKSQSITETKGTFKDVTARINGFEFIFGLGGIHGSVEARAIHSDDTHVIVDWDVASYYPNLAIANDLYPEHLGKRFCSIYKDLYERRKSYPKKSAESAMLKLALNGVYGDSNNKFSVFYDPLYTMSITLNGQLLLCKLAEKMMGIEGLQIIQINTDGVTVRIPRTQEAQMAQVAKDWEAMTKLTLERATYKSMFIRDVNNYVAVYEDASVKRKGAYEWAAQWHQDASSLVVAKVAEKVLVEGVPIRQTVEQWPDMHDFFKRIKVPRSSHLVWGGEKVQNTTRYYIAKGGKSLTKWMPPLKDKTEWRSFAVESGWQVQVCNQVKDAVLHIDFDYYVAEVEKLVLCLA